LGGTLNSSKFRTPDPDRSQKSADLDYNPEYGSPLPKTAFLSGLCVMPFPSSVRPSDLGVKKIAKKQVALY
jgi:hypothetical protein